MWRCQRCFFCNGTLYEGERQLTPKKPFPPCFGSSSWETGMRSPPTEAGGTLWLGWVLAGRRCGGEVWRAARTGGVKDARGRGAARGAARRNAIVCWNGEGKSKCSPACPPLRVTFHISTVESPHPSGPDGDTRTLPLPMPMSTPAPGEIPPFGHARLSAAHYYVSGLRDMTSFDCAHLSQSGTRFQATFPRRCPSTRFSGFGTNNPRS